MEEGEDALVLFGGVHSSVEAMQRLEEGWVQVVAVTGMCGLRGEAPLEEATRGNPQGVTTVGACRRRTVGL